MIRRYINLTQDALDIIENLPKLHKTSYPLVRPMTFDFHQTIQATSNSKYYNNFLQIAIDTSLTKKCTTT